MSAGLVRPIPPPPHTHPNPPNTTLTPPQALEARWATLNASIEELRAERAELVAATVEAEREVLVWERRVQLEKEVQVGGNRGREGRGEEWLGCGRIGTGIWLGRNSCPHGVVMQMDTDGRLPLGWQHGS